MTGVDEIVAAAARQPGGTLMLRSDKLTPAELADEVLAAAGLRQVPEDGQDPGRHPGAEPAALRSGLGHRGPADLLDGRPHGLRHVLPGDSGSLGGRRAHAR